MGPLHIRPYILAGGKASRMGRDKAMLELGGKTLLARAVALLREASWLDCGADGVTIIGDREVLEGADRAIVDRYPGCGPLGGIEAALGDLHYCEAADWAFFIPVDMPLLTAETVDLLLARWSVAIEAQPGVRACLVAVDGRLQPLISLLHRDLHGEVVKSLATGTHKVGSVLRSVKNYCYAIEIEGGRPGGVSRNELAPSFPIGKAKNEGAAVETSGQFANVNTEADLMEVGALLRQKRFADTAARDDNVAAGG